MFAYSVDVKHHDYLLCGRKATVNFSYCSEFRSCVKVEVVEVVEVAVLDSPSLTVPTISVDAGKATVKLAAIVSRVCHSLPPAPTHVH